MAIIDEEGFRANIGIVLSDKRRRLFWARRIGQDAWQFPQGGMHEGESFEDTLYRELAEEIGLEPNDVDILASSADWHYYRIPQHMLRHYHKPLCIGQKQRWFLLRLITSDQKLRLDLNDSPEFDSWRWVKYWYPVNHVIKFKREVYRQVLEEFSPVIYR
ncbi:MAG: RNA pyrophosphohydrolase [Legionellales bacterium]|nr:RNA pyrophosphohydrolase [Legionellales bacterium]